MTKVAKYISFALGFICCLYFGWFTYSFLTPQLAWIEQQHFLALDWESFLNMAFSFGGFSHWLSLLGIQFFPFPLTGTVVFLLPSILMWAAWLVICHRLRLPSAFGLLVFIPIAIFLHTAVDPHLHFWFALSTSLALLCLALLSLLRASVRIYAFSCAVPLVYWLCGPTTIIFLGGGMLLFTEKRKSGLTTIVPITIFLVMAWTAENRGWADSLRAALSPSFYYNPYMEHVPVLLWVATLSTVALGLLRLLPFDESTWTWQRRMLLTSGIFLPLFIGILTTTDKCYDGKSQFLYQLSNDASHEDWESLLHHASEHGVANNELYLNYIYLAMAHQGKLSSDPLRFTPNGANSLLVLQGEGFDMLMMQSDIDYVIGNIASAQHKAFEAQSFAIPEFMSIRALKRLVQTNIVQGHYEVAEKYLALIERTLFHKEWAARYRTFLFNDQAVNEDALMGRLRRSIPHHSRFIMLDGWYPEIEDILNTDPTNLVAATYIGLTYLFSKNLLLFKQFIDKYQHIPALQPLPVPFQEALLIHFQQDESKWKEYGIEDSTIKRYNDFRSQFIQNRNRGNVALLMRRQFGRTMWYYYMFKK